MTVWPGVPLPLPRVTRVDGYWLDETETLLIGQGLRVDLGPESRLGEIYLRVMNLDLDDSQAIVAFARKHGRLELGLLITSIREDPVLAPVLPLDDDWRATLQQQPHIWSQLFDTKAPGWELPEVGTLASFQTTARLLVDLTNAWRIVSGDPSLDSSTIGWQLDYRNNSGHDPLTASFARTLLERLLPRLLARFHPTLYATPDPWDGEDRDPDAELLPDEKYWMIEAKSAVRHAYLGEVCALELFNHIVGQQAYRQCKNDHCSQTFVVQYGTAQHGQSKREGVMYCTPQCARAQASRNYRRRRAARKRTNQ